MSEETTQPSETTTSEATTEATVVVENNGEATEQEVLYANGKYKSVSDLEKGYEELNKSYSTKLGGFDGAPKDGYQLAEGQESSPRIEALQAWGSENQMNNAALNALIDMDKASSAAATEAYIVEQKGLLGKDVDTRLTNLQDWATANGGDSDVFSAMMTSARAVEFMEGVMKNSQGTTPAQAPARASMDAEQIKAMRFAKDEFGGRKMSSDPAYRAKVNAMEEQLRTNR